MLRIPNPPEPDVPVAPDEAGNVVVKEWGEKPAFDFTPQPHWEIGERAGHHRSGARRQTIGQPLLCAQGRRRAPAACALPTGFSTCIRPSTAMTEVYPPFMVREHCMVGTGNLPKFGDNLYRDAEEDYWLIPTAEVPVTNLYRDEIIDPGQLPLYVASTPCFRREKVSAGKDVRGIKRVHQFQKVEMVKFVEPATGRDELGVADARRRGAAASGWGCPTAAWPLPPAISRLWPPSSMISRSGLPVATSGWRSAPARSSVIFRRGAPTSATVRREGGKPEYVYTLNGSGLALPRIVIAILENYQQADGSVVVPEVLRPYMGGVGVIGGGYD